MISRIELSAAAEAIRAGKLVAFPTETVYGLGANALDAAAVARIFEAKGRPLSSPLIVHVASIEQARELASEWPEHGQMLAEAFWPGPLTMVLKKRAIVPDHVTAGLDSVGLRMPNNETALALIQEAGVPIAAPSANRFTELSPTTAGHVRESFGDEVMVLDGAATQVGIESTVIALTGTRAELLRPGMITREQMEAVIGPIEIALETARRSPGQHARHYQPRTPLLLAHAGELPHEGKGAFLHLSTTGKAEASVEMPNVPSAYASRIYAVLHDLDQRGLDWIAVEPVPIGSEWDGIRDRLQRAATVR